MCLILSSWKGNSQSQISKQLNVRLSSPRSSGVCTPQSRPTSTYTRGENNKQHAISITLHLLSFLSSLPVREKKEMDCSFSYKDTFLSFFFLIFSFCYRSVFSTAFFPMKIIGCALLAPLSPPPLSFPLLEDQRKNVWRDEGCLGGK